MDNNYLERLEAILFASGEPMSRHELSKVSGISVKGLDERLLQLKNELAGRGIRLAEIDDRVMLVSAPEYGELVRKITQEELEGVLSSAALETLAIVLYKKKVSKPEIDYIRGVNCAVTLRTLMLRGLIDREVNPKDARSFVYKPTADVLKYLGVADLSQLPDFSVFQDELNKISQAQGSDNEQRTEI